MNINVTEKNGQMIIAPEGKIDYINAVELMKKIDELVESCESMVLDMADISYISSSALRVILLLDNKLKNKGGIVLKNVNQNVTEVLKITGFWDELNIQ